MITIGTRPECSGMGDILLLTAICKHTPCKVQLHPDYKRFSRFFRDIAELEFTENPTDTPNIGTGHYTQRKFNALGINSKDILPYISFNDLEKEQIKYLKSILGNSIAFNPNCSSRWSHIRETHPKNWIPILKKNNKKIYQFGISSHTQVFSNLNGIFLDLPIELLVLFYAAIGEYIGVETGDVQLMLACGGKATVYYPENTSYNPSEFQYDSDKITYIPFSKM